MTQLKVIITFALVMYEIVARNDKCIVARRGLLCGNAVMFCMQTFGTGFLLMLIAASFAVVYDGFAFFCVWRHDYTASD